MFDSDRQGRFPIAAVLNAGAHQLEERIAENVVKILEAKV